MADRATPAYPGRYTPGDLDVGLEVSFERRDGATFRGPGLQLVAGDAGTWVFRIRNRAADLHAGAELTLIRLNIQLAFLLQTQNPRRRDYCSLETDSCATLELRAFRDNVNLFTVAVSSGTLRKGQSVTVRIGDRRQGSPGSEVFWSATQAQFLLAVDPQGSGNFVGVRANPCMVCVIAHHTPRLVRLLGPTVVATGDRFDLHLGVFDRNRNLIEGASLAVHLDVPDAVEGLPEVCEISPEDCGQRVLRQIRVLRPGVYRLAARADGLPDAFASNPIVVEDEPASCVYWGDVHAHGWGDSSMHLMHLRSEKMDPLSRHRQARDIGRLDFSCPGAMSMDPAKREETWEAYREACARVDSPGSYVPFIAYEAHPGPTGGDRQVIFRDYHHESAPPDMKRPIEELEQTYGGRDDVLLEVHIGGEPPRWDQYRPERERLLEVCSGFGCAEWLLQKALQLGYMPAVCGASDLHLGLMGGPRAVETFRGRFGQKYPMNQRDSAYGTGPLTAVVAPDLCRSSLWEAIEARQTYAVSGARIYLQVACNGRAAGSEVCVRETLEVSVVCHACADIDRVDLITGEYVARTWRPNSMDFTCRLSLNAADVPGAWLYVRVAQVDGEYAWSSPVAIRRPNPPPASVGLRRWDETQDLDLSAVCNTGAGEFLPALEAYLRLEEDPSRFQSITPAGILDLHVGRCALFYCRWSSKGLPMSIRWFFEYDIPKVRFDLGWRDYGAYDELELGPELMASYG